ncbi:asparagine synthase [Vibrio brasiliensis]|uniref:asparagine synthase (glutamine-hydrolyzing) n=1 Tax=Vibrio brasiliensis LMG 20546 TaxID=945543 RepID=E8M053_9VIBR|nr:asparagine synthase [Vibrio brasiliensis]EGA63705.1 asparagine synthase [Vibrio brasiliensis LMG 20546]
MCGILGSITKRQYNLNNALRSLAHRGPDNQQVWKHDLVTFGHTRLSINDLSSNANQPFQYQDVVAVFNGEIYNYKALREQISCDYTFTTNSEVEVICALYKRYGIDFVDKLDGMFSIAIFDITENEIFCFRDRLGKNHFITILTMTRMSFTFLLNRKHFRSSISNFNSIVGSSIMFLITHFIQESR